MKPSVRRWSLAIALLALSGCQDTGLTRAMFAKFSLGPSTMTGPSGPGETTTGVTGTSSPTGDGVLTVNFSSLLQSRRVLATLADVDQVKIELRRTFSSIDVLETQVVDKAALQAGTVTCTFSGLQAGDYHVRMMALDATGQNIGYAFQDASVLAGQTATVTMTLRLDPTIPNAATGGTGGGSTPTTGSLTANATIIDGLNFPPATAATILNRRHYQGDDSLDVDVNAAGQVFVGRASLNVDRLSPALALEQSYTANDPDSPFDPFALDDASNLWLGDQKISLSGTLTTIQDINESFGRDTATDSLGNAWSLGFDGKLRMFSPDGTLQHTIDVPETDNYTLRLERGPNGTMWTGVLSWNSAPTLFRQYDSTGQKISEFTTGYCSQFAVDSQNNLWTADDGTLTKRRADGTVVASVNFNEQATLDIDASDNLWVHSRGKILKISSTGAALAAYTVPEDAMDPNVLFMGDVKIIDDTHAIMVLHHASTSPFGSEVLKLQF